MKHYQNVAIIKTAWSIDYRGGPVIGNFVFVSQNQEGHERFNFLPAFDGKFYGYLPPIGNTYSVPNPTSKTGWLLVFVSKRPGQSGLYIVGWYEDATFTGAYASRPEYSAGVPFERDRNGNDYVYAVTAAHAVLVPEPLRVERLYTDRIKSTPIAYLRGGPKSDPWRDELAREVFNQLGRLSSEIELEAPLPEGGKAGSFATNAEYRRQVEEAAMDAAAAYLGSKGYKVTPVHRENRGYDILATRSREPRELHVEVKGTGGLVRQFLMTRKEHNYINEPQWRLAIVTSALGEPKVDLLDAKEAQKVFSFEVLTWQVSENAA